MSAPISELYEDLNIASLDYELVEKTMCFYLSKQFQSSPPEPTHEDVFIMTMPELNVYTRYAYLFMIY